MPILLKEFSESSIPATLGGKFELFNEAFNFDMSEGGPLYYPGLAQDLAGIYG